MKLYRTGFGKELIEEVEVVKQTDKSVWLKSSFNSRIRRYAKRSSYDNFWETIEEAKNYLTEKYNRTITTSENKIQIAKLKLKELNNY